MLDGFPDDLENAFVRNRRFLADSIVAAPRSDRFEKWCCHSRSLLLFSNYWN